MFKKKSPAKGPRQRAASPDSDIEEITIDEDGAEVTRVSDVDSDVSLDF